MEGERAEVRASHRISGLAIYFAEKRKAKNPLIILKRQNKRVIETNEENEERIRSEE